MSGPILSLEREKACRGAGPCIPRKMTDEEKQKYANIKPLKSKPAVGVQSSEFVLNKEVKKGMKKTKINPPSKEELLELLSQQNGKTRAIRFVSATLHYSMSTVAGWVKGYGIEFDENGKVVKPIVDDNESGSGQPQNEEKPDDGLAKNAPDDISCDESAKEAGSNDNSGDLVIITSDDETAPEGSITIRGQETKKFQSKVGYAEHDIGNATVIFDFRQDLIKVVTPNAGEMSSEVAAAVAMEILDVLGYE